MNRKSNKILKIQLIDTIDFKAFKEWMKETNYELVLFKNEAGRFIAFFDHPPKELFKWSSNFTIIRGSTYLWYNGVPVTSINYRKVKETEGENTEVEYTYLPYEEMTNVPPKVEEEELNIN